jgi:hypothetical protein
LRRHLNELDTSKQVFVLVPQTKRKHQQLSSEQELVACANSSPAE